MAAPAFGTSRGTAGARWSRDGAHYNLLNVVSDVLFRLFANTTRAGFMHVQHVNVNRGPHQHGPRPMSKKLKKSRRKENKDIIKKLDILNYVPILCKKCPTRSKL